MTSTESRFALILLLAVLPVWPQSSSLPRRDPLLDELNAIAEEFHRRVRFAGCEELSAKPLIVVDTPPQLSMYTRKDNTIHTSRWENLPPDVQDTFTRWAGYAGDRTAKELFDEMFHRFFFVHELAHALQVQAKRDSDDVYAFELEANRITVAYWAETDATYLAGSVERLRRINGRLPSPVPASEDAEAYFNSNYRRLGSSPDIYGWFQSRMVVQAGSEKPLPPFAVTVRRLLR